MKSGDILSLRRLQFPLLVGWSVAEACLDITIYLSFLNWLVTGLKAKVPVVKSLLYTESSSSSMPSCNCCKAPLMWATPPVSVIFVKLNLCSVQNFCSPCLFPCCMCWCTGISCGQPSVLLSPQSADLRGTPLHFRTYLSALLLPEESQKFILEVSIHFLFSYRISLSFYSTQGLSSVGFLQRVCVCPLCLLRSYSVSFHSSFIWFFGPGHVPQKSGCYCTIHPLLPET